MDGGPEAPPRWSYNPSAWTQRLPIIVLALIGLYVSRYLAGCQLGHISGVWDPFFAGSSTDPQYGTEEIITSSVSKAWPVSDAAVGGTMPWLVVLFGLMIAPLGITSIAFIIIQPIVIGTWTTIALVGATAVLLQIPCSLDELLATLQFVRRRTKAGRNWLRVLLFGDTDEMLESGTAQPVKDEFDRSPGTVLKSVIGGVSLPWNLALSALIGLSLLLTRLTLGNEGDMANADHVIGALILTVISVAAAEVARPARYLNVLLGGALFVTPFVYEGSVVGALASVAAGAALIMLSVRCGAIRKRYGHWNPY